MSSDQNQHDAEDPATEQAGSAAPSSDEDEPIGAEIGMSDEGTTFEPEEDPEGATE